MSGSSPELELRPNGLAEAFVRRFGESRDQANRRLVTVVLPAAAAPMLVLVMRSYRGAKEDGVAAEALRLGTAVAVVALLVGLMFLAHARQRVRLTADELEVRGLVRTRRHPRAAAHRAVSTQLKDLSHTAPATFVLDRWGNCLVALSWVQFDRFDVEALLARLGVGHEERLDETITLRQMRRRYPGAFSLARRRPWLVGFLVAAAMVLGIVAVAFVIVSSG